MQIRTSSKKQNSILLLLLHNIVLVALLHPPPTVSSFQSWGSPSRALFPAANGGEARTSAVGKKKPADAWSWTSVLPFRGEEGDGAGSGDANTERVMREMGIEYHPTTSPKLGVVAVNQIWDVLCACFLFASRRGSGTFAWGYSVSVAPRNASLYTPLAIGPFQLLESSSSSSSSPSPTGRTARTKIQIYDDSPSSPHSRPVHETISQLGLEVTLLPCPIGGGTRRTVQHKYGAGTTFPLLIDAHNGVELFHTADIIYYLLRFYARPATSPAAQTAGRALPPLPPLGRRGAVRRVPSDPPLRPLVLYSFEGCPFSVPVREELYRLEIGFRYVSCPRGGHARQRLFEMVRVQRGGDGGGRFQVPYLEDPNTGVGLFESAVIVQYLRGAYGVAQSPVRYM